MKKQIVIIHGGDTYNSYDDFVRALENSKPEKDDFKKNSHNIRIWRDDLELKFAETHEVFQPRMPNKDFCRYSEWKIWFEKLLSLLNDEPIFIGHSMGGIFLAKYFAENADAKKLKALFLVAAPWLDNDPMYTVGDFRLPEDLIRLAQLGSKVYLYASKDDMVVPFSDLEKYSKALPNAQVKVFEDRGHFKLDVFPEIIEDIRSIS